MTEELKNPYVNLPRAIYISLPLVTLIYVFANVAYLAVLTPMAMEASNAIAVTFADKVLGMMSLVHAATGGSLSFRGAECPHHDLIQTRLPKTGRPRMCFVGARYGHFPAMLSHINVDRFTPTPSLVFLNILSLIMLCTSDVYVLITYSSFVESFFIMLSVGGMLWLRYKRPNMTRPIKALVHVMRMEKERIPKGLLEMKYVGKISRRWEAQLTTSVQVKKRRIEAGKGEGKRNMKVSLWVPIVFIVVCMFLVFVPCYYVPYEVGMGVLITVTGIPAFFLGVVWEKKPSWFIHALGNITIGVQKLFLSAREEKEDGSYE
ncbi:unnamed protein product [Timema podura]|uniref:G protein-coupled receptor n=1 Tax=Timema podura TaxID=61482 RepID=A0ABN7P2H3_TIMPD|nr:unnamed protein product [Timema podura]